MVDDVRPTHEPKRKAPISHQVMWELALRDFEHERGRYELTKANPNAKPIDIASAEKRLRIRRAICNAIDFLITNSDDVNAVLAGKHRKVTAHVSQQASEPASERDDGDHVHLRGEPEAAEGPDHGRLQ